jgi:NADH-quinone oxidoreductase subunit K
MKIIIEKLILLNIVPSNMSMDQVENLLFSILLFLVPFLLYALALFSIFLNRQNIIRFLISLEVMLLAINLLIIELSFISNKPQMLILVPFFLALAAVEVAISLGLLIVAYGRKKSISFVDFKKLRG